MSLTPEERRARRKEFRKMNPADKVSYLFTYYRLPILLGLILLALLIGGVCRWVSHKEPALYAAYINVSMGEELEGRLNEDFLAAAGYNPRRSEVYLYRALYLSDDAADSDHEYAYASRLKLLASINAKQLDVVLMNREAYDILSKNGYLLPLPELLAQSDCAELEPLLAENMVIVEDNAVEFELNEAERYEAVTEEAANAIDLSSHPLFQQAGFPDAVYLGVIANSPRLPAVGQYLQYLNALAANGETE